MVGELKSFAILEINTVWGLEQVNPALSQLKDENDTAKASALVQDDRFTPNYFVKNELETNMIELLDLLATLKLENALVKMADAFLRFGMSRVSQHLPLFLSYKYQCPENALKIEEMTLKLLLSLQGNEEKDPLYSLRVLMKSPLSIALINVVTPSSKWYSILSLLAIRGELNHFRYVIIYMRRFPDRVFLSLAHARGLLEPRMAGDDLLIYQEALLYCTLQHDIYKYIQEHKLLMPDQVEMLPKSFQSCYSEGADFTEYLARLHLEYALNETISFLCHCLKSKDLTMGECCDYAVESGNYQMILELASYGTPSLLTGHQYSNVYLKCSDEEHTLHRILRDNSFLLFEIEELHFHFKPVSFAILELLSKNLFLINDYLFEYVLPYLRTVGSFHFLSRLESAHESMKELQKFLEQFPPCLQRYFHGSPNQIKHADELYYIAKATTDEDSLKLFVKPFMLAASDDLLEQVLAFALEDELQHVIKIVQDMVETRQYIGRVHITHHPQLCDSEGYSLTDQ